MNNNIDVNSFVASKVLIESLEENVEMNIADLKKYIMGTNIFITGNQIRKFLNQQLEKENFDLKERIETRSKKENSIKNLAFVTKMDIEVSAQRFVDDIELSRYKYVPYTLEYFKKYIKILREKILLLIEIIEAIANKDLEKAKPYLKSLDISIDENGSILYNDVLRLVIPTVDNINNLKDKLTRANNLETYLNFRVSRESLYRDGIMEGELYPSSELQLKNLCYSYVKGYIPLSYKQKENLQEEESSFLKSFIKHMSKYDIDD